MKNTDIRYFRLYSGESLVAEVLGLENDSENHIVGAIITYPMRVDIDSDMSGRPVMNMVEWIPIALVKERKMVLKFSDVQIELTPSDRMKKAYVGFTEKIKKAEGSYLIGDAPREDDYASMDEMQDGLGTLEELIESLRSKKSGRLH